MNFKQPILAASLLPPNVESNDGNVLAAMKALRYPVFATLKKDGIRACRLNGTLLSRKLKHIPNRELCKESIILPGGFDMELWSKDLPYDRIESIVMSQHHVDWKLIQYHILDWIPVLGDSGYAARCQQIMIQMTQLPQDRVKFSPPIRCDSAEQLLMFEKTVIEETGEGICFRLGNSPYKQGRSTLKEQYLVKHTRWIRSEAEVIGFEEQQVNCNIATTDKTGKSKRSHAIERMVGKNTLGAFQVRDINSGLEFTIGTGVGLTDVVRKNIWEKREEFLHKILTYKSKAHGVKVKPRSPVWVGWRDILID